MLEDYRTAPIDDRDKALFAFIEKMNAQSNQIRRDDLDRDRYAALATDPSDEASWDEHRPNRVQPGGPISGQPAAFPHRMDEAVATRTQTIHLDATTDQRGLAEQERHLKLAAQETGPNSGALYRSVSCTDDGTTCNCRSERTGFPMSFVENGNYTLFNGMITDGRPVDTARIGNLASRSSARTLRISAIRSRFGMTGPKLGCFCSIVNDHHGLFVPRSG